MRCPCCRGVYSSCLRCKKPWVRSPAPKPNNKARNGTKDSFNGMANKTCLRCSLFHWLGSVKSSTCSTELVIDSENSAFGAYAWPSGASEGRHLWLSSRTTFQEDRAASQQHTALLLCLTSRSLSSGFWVMYYLRPCMSLQLSLKMSFQTSGACWVKSGIIQMW